LPPVILVGDVTLNKPLSFEKGCGDSAIDFQLPPGSATARLMRRLLAITGHTFHDLIGTHDQQDVDLDKLLASLAICSNPSVPYLAARTSDTTSISRL
jgi:hypothetical protein